MVLIADGRSRCGMTGFITPVAAPHFHGHHTIRLPNNTGGTAAYAVQHVETQAAVQHVATQAAGGRPRSSMAATPYQLARRTSKCAPGVASPCAPMLLACPLPQAPGGSNPPPLPAAASPSHPSTGAAAGLHTPLQSQSLAARHVGGGGGGLHGPSRGAWRRGSSRAGTRCMRKSWERRSAHRLFSLTQRVRSAARPASHHGPGRTGAARIEKRRAFAWLRWANGASRLGYATF
jgi:hypothetical protein